MASPTTGIKRSANHLSPPTATDPSNKKAKANGSITSFFGVPKPKNGGGVESKRLLSTTASSAPAAPTVPTSSFNKQKWASSLSPEQKELLRLEIGTLDESWLAQLKDEVTSPEFLNLKRFLKKERDSGKTIFPPEEDVYSWSRHTPLHKVKAVILGQDPYHNHNQAHGLAFSVRPPTRSPPSLVNIYTAIKNDYPTFQPPPNKEGLLIPWAERGVLMLNTCLTVRAHEAFSHSNKGWERFTQKAIDAVARVRTRGVVFLAWGTPAAKRVAKINRERHCVLNSVHPSPLSASRGWFNCGHFKKCNDWLAERYGEDEVIDWALTPNNSIFPKKESSSTPVSAVGPPPTAVVEKPSTTCNGNTSSNSNGIGINNPAKPDSKDNDKENTPIVKLNGHGSGAPPGVKEGEMEDEHEHEDDEFEGGDDLDALEALAAADAEVVRQTTTTITATEGNTSSIATATAAASAPLQTVTVTVPAVTTDDQKEEE